MRKLFWIVLSIVLVGCTGTEESNNGENSGSQITDDNLQDSLKVATSVTPLFDTTGVDLYYIPTEYTEFVTESILDTDTDTRVKLVRYCQTKEGIELGYELPSGSRFRIHYRDWAGRIIVTKGDSIITNYSFDKDDYSHLRDADFWVDKTMQDLKLVKTDKKSRSVEARFFVLKPNEDDGITIDVAIDSAGNATMTEVK